MNYKKYLQTHQKQKTSQEVTGPLDNKSLLNEEMEIAKKLNSLFWSSLWNSFDMYPWQSQTKVIR